MNVMKGIIIGGSVVGSFAAGMAVMFKISEHYQKIIRYWIQSRNDPTMIGEIPEGVTRRRKPPRPPKDDPLEVKDESKERA